VVTLNFVSFLSRSFRFKLTQRQKNDLKAKGHWSRLFEEPAQEKAPERWNMGTLERPGAKVVRRNAPEEPIDNSLAGVVWTGTRVAIPSYRRGEKRRSSRVTLAVPIRVDGENVAGEKFIVSTVTVALSQYGCLVQLDEEVLVDQTLVLMNEHTRQSAQGRIVSTRRQRNGHKYVGVEFISPSENFWRLTFVKPGAKSLKRTYGAPEA
jgi:hypothetical protein